MKQIAGEGVGGGVGGWVVLYTLCCRGVQNESPTLPPSSPLMHSHLVFKLRIHSIVPMTGTRVFTYPQSLISDPWNKDQLGQTTIPSVNYKVHLEILFTLDQKCSVFYESRLGTLDSRLSTLDSRLSKKTNKDCDAFKCTQYTLETYLIYPMSMIAILSLL